MKAIIVTIEYNYLEDIVCSNTTIKKGTHSCQRYICKNIESIGECINSFLLLYLSEITDIKTEYVVLEGNRIFVPFT